MDAESVAVGSAVQSVVGRIESAAAALQTPQADLDDPVHVARKAIKRGRALLRLLSDLIAPSRHRMIDDALRAASRVLASARDAKVVLDTFDLDRGTWAHAAGEQPLVPLRACLAGEREDTAADRRRVAEAAARLGEAGTEMAAVEGRAADDVGRAISSGLKRSYGRGRKRMRIARNSMLPEDFHAMRRHVKYLRYQLEAVSAGGLIVPTGLIADFDRLGETLGRAHDLLMFEAALGRCCDDAAARGALVERSAEARRHLESSAVSAGVRLYDLEPGAFVASLLTA